MNDDRKLYRRMKIMTIMQVIQFIILIGIIVFLLMKETGRLPWPDASGESAVGATTGQDVSEQAPGETIEETEATAAELADMVRIETPYLELYYPSQWEQYLKWEQKEENGVLTTAFSCDIDGVQAPLFDVHFGSEQAGEAMGYIHTEEGKIPFGMTFHDFIPDETWSEDDAYVLYAMQEAVNELLQSVRESEKYAAD